MEMLSEDDLNLADMTREELDRAWNLWFDLAQSTNDSDPLYTHGVFVLWERRVEGGALGEALGKVGIGQEEHAEGDQVRLARGDRRVAGREVVAAVEDERPPERRAQHRRHQGSRAAHRLHHVEVGEAEAVELPRGMTEGRRGVRVAHRVEGAGGGEAHAHPVRSPDAGHRRRHLPQEAGAVLDRTAVGVRPLVRAVAQELVDQVAVGAVDLDAVEARRQGAAGAVRELLDDAGDLVQLQGARDSERLRPFAGEGLPLGCHGRRRHRLSAARLQQRVGDPADVPELGEDPPAPLVDGVGHPAPARELLLGMNARRAGVTHALRRDLGPLGHDQPGRSALGVVGDRELARDVPVDGPVAGHRRHHHAVAQRIRSDLYRGMEGGVLLGWRG
jgi:hypothetical protein